VIEEMKKEPHAPVDNEEKNPESKLLYEMKKLRVWFNHEAPKIIESLKSGREMILDHTEIAMMIQLNQEGLMKISITLILIQELCRNVPSM
jgi:hypothetical protein